MSISVQAVDLLIQMVEPVLLLTNFLIRLLEFSHLGIIVVGNLIDSLLHLDNIDSGRFERIVSAPHLLLETRPLVLLVLEI